MTDAAHPQDRESLERSIPFHSYITLGLGIIVGVGWVVYSGHWLEDGGPLGAIIAFLLGGLLLLPVGLCYAELTAALPLAGGEVSFSYKAFGPLLAFLSGWALALAYTIVTPFETIAIGALLETLYPPLATEALYHVGGARDQERVSLSTIVPGVGVGVFLIWLNLRGARAAAKFQQLIVYALLLCAAVFVAAALAKGDFANLTPLFATPPGSRHGLAAVLGSIISVLVVVPFFMAGFDAIPQAAEEAGDTVPPRQLGIAILAAIVAGSVFYVLIILAVAISMPWQESAQLPMATSAVFEQAFGYVWAAKLVIFAALLGLVSTLNGMYIASSRLLFSMGRGGLLPHWFATVHPVHHTPGNAMLFVGAVSLLGPFVGKYALIPIVNCSSAVFSAVLLITCLATLRLRRTAVELHRPFRAPGPALVLGPLVAALLIVLMVLPNSPGQLSALEFLIITVWLLVGVGAYVWRQRRHPLDGVERDHLILGEYR